MFDLVEKIRALETSNILLQQVNAIILKQSIVVATNFFYETYINVLNPLVGLPFLFCETKGIIHRFTRHITPTSIRLLMEANGITEDCCILLSRYQYRLLHQKTQKAKLTNQISR